MNAVGQLNIRLWREAHRTPLKGLTDFSVSRLYLDNLLRFHADRLKMALNGDSAVSSLMSNCRLTRPVRCETLRRRDPLFCDFQNEVNAPRGRIT